MKKIMITLSVVAILLISGLSLSVAIYCSPTLVAERTARQEAEKRFSEYLETSYTDKISFEVSYIYTADIYSALCVNEETKEKFVVYEYEDGTFAAYSYLPE